MSGKRNTKDGLYDIPVYPPQVQTDNFFIQLKNFMVPKLHCIFSDKTNITNS